MAGEATATIASVPAGGHYPAQWRRLVLLVVLLHLPLFFNGCDVNEARFSAGAAVSFAELTVRGQPSLANTKITWWSPWRCAANLIVLAGGIWLACRHVPSVARLAQSRWFAANLLLVAVVFDSWLYLPSVWLNLVVMPTLHLATFLQSIADGDGSSNEATFPYVVSLSARLYYAVCLVGVGGVALGLRFFFRRYFFVSTGPAWQVQLGGLIVVVLVLGTAIGLVARLLMQ